MGKGMKKRKLPPAALAGIVLLFLLAGCRNGKNAVGAPSVPMKTVTQNSEEDLATFEFQVPESWASASKAPLTVIGYPESAVHKDFKTAEDAYPYTVDISNYYHTGLALSEEDKQMYKDLFAGKPDAFEERMNASPTSEDGIGDPSSVRDWFDLLLPQKNGSSQSSGTANQPKITFEYQHYDGTNGKITEVHYSYTYKGKKTDIVQCYREDIPYVITGALDDSADLPSGKIALWVADSLKVTEHFTVEGNTIQKEG